MKLLARLLWCLAPTEAGLRKIHTEWAIPEPDMRWIEAKQNLDLPIWRAIRDYAVGHTVCYRWACQLEQRINQKTCGGPKFRASRPLF